jgi:hypothetical protein
MIFFTNFSIPSKFAGFTRGPFIFIRPSHKNDEGLIAHEKVHRNQWFRTLGFHSLMYIVSTDYRLKSEVEAYKEQMKFGLTKEKAASYIANKYGINITIEDAMKLL